ncbi:DNA-binding response OmpR family regulator [Bradyrhizobium sp. LM6.9]
MSARILVVDDVPANVKLLEARLSAEYFDVMTASNGTEALEISRRSECDIILLDVMMPDMDGFEVCRRLKTDPATHHIPVVMVTALDSPSDRNRGLEAGADDFLTKPVSDVVLIARVRSLTRLKMMTDELRMRAITSLEIGMQAPERTAVADTGKGGRILLVDDRQSSYERLATILAAEHTIDVEPNPTEALFHAAEGNYDLLIVSLDLNNFDGLRLCSQARSLERTRHVPILAIADPENSTRLLRGLEIGVNDYLLRPIDKIELLARARTQIRRRRYTDHLRDNVQNSIEMAITDALTTWAAQSPLHGEPSRDAGRAGRDPRQAAGADDFGHRLLQVDQRQLRPRRRRRRAARIRRAGAQVDPRHRSRLPLRRRGIRHRDAGDRSPRRRHGRRAAAPLDRGRAVRDPQGHQAHRSHDLDRADHVGAEGRGGWRRPQARRHRDVSRQARRPQPRGVAGRVRPLAQGRAKKNAKTTPCTVAGDGEINGLRRPQNG